MAKQARWDQHAHAAVRALGESGDLERVVTGLGGLTLASWGMRRGGLLGIVGAFAGGCLVTKAVTGQFPLNRLTAEMPFERDLARRYGWSRARAVTNSVHIEKPREEVYRLWRDFNNLSRFMQHVERIEVLDERRSHWVVKAPMGRVVEWDARITEDVPNEHIAWESEPGADVSNAGWVDFRRADGGTEVTTVIAYEPPGGDVGRMIARLWGEEPGVQAYEDLVHLKHLLEAGEGPSAAGRGAGQA